jgi:hypothetical protein
MYIYIVKAEQALETTPDNAGIYVYICTYFFVYMYVYVYICIYI